MKKTVLLLISLGFAGFCYAGANPSIVWSNSVAIYDWTGALVSGDSAWVVRLYESADNTINFNNLLPSGDDTYTGAQFAFGISNLADGFGKGIIADSYYGNGIADADKIYSVIFNSSNVLTATRWAVIDDAVATVSYVSFTFNYNPGGTVAGDWQVVPEPASAMMLIFGAGVGMTIYRIRRNAMRR